MGSVYGHRKGALTADRRKEMVQFSHAHARGGEGPENLNALEMFSSLELNLPNLLPTRTYLIFVHTISYYFTLSSVLPYPTLLYAIFN